ncbi:unnamed protein product, partial [Allacma fusca]
MLRSNSVQ